MRFDKRVGVDMDYRISPAYTDFVHPHKAARVNTVLLQLSGQRNKRDQWNICNPASLGGKTC